MTAIDAARAANDLTLFTALMAPFIDCATCSTMQSIGVRELRQHASDFLRRVEAGETIQVTDRGRPIAMLVPIVHDSPLERLAAAGRLSLAREDLLALGPPLRAKRGVTSASTALARARESER